MTKYKRYNLEYVLLQHDTLMTHTRNFKDLEDLEYYLDKLRKKDYYVKSTKYELDIIETEIS